MPSGTPTGSSPSTGSFGLPRAARLRQAKDFRRVYARGLRLRARHLVLVACRRQEPGHRLGVSVSKDHGRAVRRNKIKRILREAFRLSRPRLPGQYDMILIPQQQVRRFPLLDVQKELRHLVQQLEAGRGRPRSGRRPRSRPEKKR